MGPVPIVGRWKDGWLSESGADTSWVVVEQSGEAGALADHLAREVDILPIVARLLVRRGVRSAEDARRFLSPSLADLHDPFMLPDLEAGVDRVAAAVRAGEKILVHGDYDVDGVTSAALLVRTLRALKANVDYRLPHRLRDGYDIKPASVAEAADSGAKVIITCDCGTGAAASAQLASELGIDFIITDHHEPGPALPPAAAVVNPKRADAAYPFAGLAGVGVAFKFAQGLVRKLGHDESRFIRKFLDLVALGTVGDVVPLLGENRAIVKHGLELISTSKKVGLRTMLRSTSLDTRALTAYHLAYVLSPRINAAGRMDDAAIALRLLLTSDEDEALMLTKEMERCNAERKVEQERILVEAIEQVRSKDLDRTRILVLSGEGWNSGVVGIVAGRIRELFGRPGVLISRNEETGRGGGSARSVEEFNMLEGLRHCSDLLERFGGHALAAGLSLPLENIPLLEERLNKLATEVIPEEALEPRIEIEEEIQSEDITRRLADALEAMEPFGTGNPEPLFATRNLLVLHKQRMGDGSHLRLRVQGNGGPPITCVGFGQGDMADRVQLGGNVDMCYSIRLNRFNGTETVQLFAKDIRVP